GTLEPELDFPFYGHAALIIAKKHKGGPEKDPPLETAELPRYSLRTVTNVCWPLRSSSTNAVPRDGTASSARLASCGVRTGRRLISRITSPREMPARAAVLDGSTSLTSTPSTSEGSRRRRATSVVRGLSVIPKPCNS